MKLQPDRFEVPSVTAYGEGWLAISGQRHETAVLLGGAQGVEALEVRSLAQVDAALLERACRISHPEPEVILVGTGPKHQTLPPSLTHTLLARRVGVECMNTPAACRTYNILVGEGRRVCAILLV